jgi:hypothetical protein
MPLLADRPLTDAQINQSINQAFIIAHDMSLRHYNIRQHSIKDKNKTSAKLVQTVYNVTLSKQRFRNSRQWKFMTMSSNRVAVNTHLRQQLL